MLLAFVPGILAAVLVIITLVLIAVKGHPEGLLTVIVGVAVPVVLWGAWRLARLAGTRLRSARDVRPSSQADLDVRPSSQADLDVRPSSQADLDVRPSSQAELKVELKSTSVRWPPTGQPITFPLGR